MYNHENKQVASDVYHNYLDNVHSVLEDFSVAAHYQSMDKMHILWNQLHIAGGAKYIYADIAHDEFTHQWLSKKGKKIIEELIVDARKSNMKGALQTLEDLQKILEEKRLIN